MIRRSLNALAAAAGAELCCAAGSLFRVVRLVARVDRVSVWTVLNTRRNVALTAWRSALTPGDRLLFAGVGVAAAAGVLAAPLLGPLLAASSARIRATLAAHTTRRG
ncbi:hypothetical protein [Catenulispora subtropica]|uniref:Uncharacterized protein n=1 Tax=Catenulispora subtropica TaxID=450798 RepID=A0ABP5BRP0_9ACTN